MRKELLTDIGTEAVRAPTAGMDAIKEENILAVMPVVSYCILLTDGKTFRPYVYWRGMEK
jgi:Holliday junction resolvase